MNNADYYKFLLDLNEKDLIKECVKLKDAVTNLSSVNKQYEKVLNDINCKIEKVEVEDSTSFLINPSSENTTRIYETNITFPTYRFAYKSEKNYIQNIIREVLAYGKNEEFIKNNAVMHYGKRVIILEE